MIRVPKELVPYIEYKNGTVVAEHLPDELEHQFKEFKKVYDDLMSDLSDY